MLVVCDGRWASDADCWFGGLDKGWKEEEGAEGRGGAETEGRFLKSGTEGWQVEDLSRQPGSGVGSGHQRFLVVALLKVQQSFRFSRKLFVLFLLRNGNHYAVCLFFSRKNKVMHF